MFEFLKARAVKTLIPSVVGNGYFLKISPTGAQKSVLILIFTCKQVNLRELMCDH